MSIMMMMMMMIVAEVRGDARVRVSMAAQKRIQGCN
jgi:hypothetical protein